MLSLEQIYSNVLIYLIIKLSDSSLSVAVLPRFYHGILLWDVLFYVPKFPTGNSTKCAFAANKTWPSPLTSPWNSHFFA